MNQAVDLNQFQDVYFSRVVERCAEECVDYYQERLISIYVWGSVHRQEAVRGVSDLDVVVFVNHIEKGDREWRNNHINDQLEKEFPDLKWGLIPHADALYDAPHNAIATSSEQHNFKNRSFACLLQHDATLVFGEDVTRGLTLPPPDIFLARWAFKSTLMLARYAAG